MDTKFKETEYQYGNVTICVSRPVLSDTERARREGNLQIALQQFGKAMEDARAGKGVSL